VGIAGNAGSWANHWVTNPGRCLSVIAVGATNQDNTWWNDSSYGPADLPENSSVEIVAPGNLINSIKPQGDWGIGRGTSFAAPQVSGAVALMKQLQKGLTADQLRAKVKRAATPLGFAGRDEKLGMGLLDCLTAISDLMF